MQELTLEAFIEATDRDPRIAKRFRDSHSPGPVADRLGVSRQRVHQLLESGRLDGCRLVHKDGSLAAIVIFDDSVRNYMRTRRPNYAA